MTHIRIVDLPCGWGKSSVIMKSFKRGQKYLVVTPYLSEVQRFVDEAQKHSGFELTMPVPTKAGKGKLDHVEKLLRAGRSVATTQALFYKLGTLAKNPLENTPYVPDNVDVSGMPLLKQVQFMKFKHVLDDYNLIVDEVVDPFDIERTVRQGDFDADYVDEGLVKVDESGLVSPTLKWTQKYDNGSKTFSRSLYEKAQSGALWKLDDKLFVTTVPIELFTRPKTVTIYTYLSEGSFLLHFLRKLQKDRPEITLELRKLPKEREAEWLADVATSVTIKSIEGLDKQKVRNRYEYVKLNHSAQLSGWNNKRTLARVVKALKHFRYSELKDTDLSTVMLTCAQERWIKSKPGEMPKAGPLARDVRMFGRATKRAERFDEVTGRFVSEWGTTGVQFVPNTTRGTNKHSHCTRAIYLYDQNPNPQMLTFLGMDRDSREARDFCDAYALTELVQWLFRSAIRKGGINGTGTPPKQREPVTIYVPNERMRNLLLNWLATGEVNKRSLQEAA